jgi:hypothetical protein
LPTKPSHIKQIGWGTTESTDHFYSLSALSTYILIDSSRDPFLFLSRVAMRIQTIAAAAVLAMKMPHASFASFSTDVGDLGGFDGFVFQGTADNYLGECF